MLSQFNLIHRIIWTLRRTTRYILYYSWCLMQRLLPCWFYCLVKCYLMCVFVSRFWQYSEIKSNTAFNSLQEQEIKLIICKNHTHTQMLIVFVWWVNNSVYQRDSGQVSVQLSNRTGRPVNSISHHLLLFCCFDSEILLLNVLCWCFNIFNMLERCWSQSWCVQITFVEVCFGPSESSSQQW